MLETFLKITIKQILNVGYGSEFTKWILKREIPRKKKIKISLMKTKERYMPHYDVSFMKIELNIPLLR